MFSRSWTICIPSYLFFYVGTPRSFRLVIGSWLKIVGFTYGCERRDIGDDPVTTRLSANLSWESLNCFFYLQIFDLGVVRFLVIVANSPRCSQSHTKIPASPDAPGGLLGDLYVSGPWRVMHEASRSEFTSFQRGVLLNMLLECVEGPGASKTPA